MKVTNFKKLFNYFSSPQIILGIFIQLFFIPFALFIRSWHFLFPNVTLESLYLPNPTHNKRLLLIHGSGANDKQWLLQKMLYIPKDYQVFVLNLPDNNKSIKNYESFILQKLDFLEFYNPTPITILGCSMGGLVASMAEIKRPNFIKKIITFGTPFKGSPILNFTKFKSERYKDMTPNSIFLKELEEKVTQTKITSFGGYLDPLVPHKYSFLGNAKSYGFNACHYSVTLLPSIWKIIQQEI